MGHSVGADQPTPQGLDGGRLQYFGLSKFNEAFDFTYKQAPDFSDADVYVAWLRSQPPRFIPIAQYENGVLTRECEDANAESIIQDIKETARTYRVDELVLAAYSTLHEVCEGDKSPKAAKAEELLRNVLNVAEGRNPWQGDSLALMKQAEKALLGCTDEYESKAPSRMCQSRPTS